MTVAARLRKLEAQRRVAVLKRDDEGLSFIVYEHDSMWPLLADLAEAAEGITDDPEFHEPGPLTIMKGQKARLAAALAHLAAELGGQDA